VITPFAINLESGKVEIHMLNEMDVFCPWCASKPGERCTQIEGDFGFRPGQKLWWHSARVHALDVRLQAMGKL